MVSLDEIEIRSKKEKGFVHQLFIENNKPSSKRFVGILGSLTLFATLIANSFTDVSTAPSDTLVNAVALLSFGALGITGAEKIFGKK